MFIRSYLSVILVALVLFTLCTPISSAQVKPLGADECKQLGIDCPQDGAASLRNTIIRIVNIGLSFVGIIAVIVLIYAGLKYILARGDEKELEKAKSIIIYAIIGIIVIGLSAAIVRFVFRAVAPAPQAPAGGGGGAGGVRPGPGGGVGGLGRPVD